MNDSSTLFEAFPPVSTDEWEAQIIKDLNGADYQKKLRWKTGEGISPLPFYRREDLQQLNQPDLIMNPAKQAWEVREPVYDTTIEEASESTSQALNRGSDALQLILRLARATDDKFKFKGLPLHTQADLRKLMEGISLHKTPLHIDSGILSPAILAMLWHEVERQSLDPGTIQGTLYYDPFANLLQHGFLPQSPDLPENVSRLASFCQQHFPQVRPLCVDGRIYHDTGGTVVQELGFALSSATALLSSLTNAGFTMDEAAPALHFTFSTGSKYFLEIAKFRAIRSLWKNLLEAFEADPQKYPAHIHAETSRWNKTIYDPYTNMLRTSTEGMSAVLGGCDALTVLPFDESFQKADDFSKRIARNSQIIMREEAHLSKVQDPAAGSYYIEQLTNDIAREAWKLFQEVEEHGGMLQAVEDGFVQSSLESARQRQDLAIANRERTFVGTNQYPNPNEFRKDELTDWEQWRDPDFSGQTISDPLDVDKWTNFLSGGGKLDDIIASLDFEGDAKIPPLEPYRGARAYEQLRLATEQSDTCPKVLNIPIGSRKIRKARSAFSTNFFGCIGYKIADPIGFENIAEAVETIQKQQPDIAVLCSSDDEYQELVPDLCKKINQMENRPLLVLAGYPNEQLESYRKTGIDLFIYSGCNVLKTLKKIQQKLGIIEK